MRASQFRQPSDPETIGRATIGGAVKRYRLARGWSQHQLSWAVGLNQSTISRLEKGTLGGIRFSTLAQILGELAVRGDVLLAPGGPPPPTRRLPGQPKPGA